MGPPPGQARFCLDGVEAGCTGFYRARRLVSRHDRSLACYRAVLFRVFGNLRSRAARRTRSAALWALRAKLRLVQGLLSEAVSSLVGTQANLGRADALV